MRINDEKEQIKYLNELLKPKNIKVVEFVWVDGKKRCVAVCDIHGDGREFGTPWVPECNNLKNGSGCPKCSGNYFKTIKESVIEVIGTSEYITFMGFLENYKGNKTKCAVYCKTHGDGRLFGNPWTLEYQYFKKSSKCPKCTGSYLKSSNEAKLEANSYLSKNINFLEFLEIYKGSKTKCAVSCIVHGDGRLFDNQWVVKYHQFKQGISCPKCSNNYKHSEKEIIKDIENKIDDNLNFESFIGEKFKNLNTKCILSCNKHGLSSNWDNPSYPSCVYIKKNGFTCDQCLEINQKEGVPKPTRRLNKKTAESRLIDSLSDTNLTFINFENDIYINARTKCIIECSIHGNGETWSNPWKPTYDNALRGTRCPKCTGNYELPLNELIHIINEKAILGNYEFNGFIDGYKSLRTRGQVTCNIHGRGENFEKPWIPTLANLKNGSQCSRCKKYEHAIHLFREHKSLYSKKKTLYFLTLLDKKKNNVFYKIGFHSNSLKIRYSKSSLIKDQVEILSSEEIEMPNMIACLSEYSILIRYKDDVKYMLHRLKHCHGGTECFGVDITKGKGLQLLIDEAIDSLDDSFEMLKFSEDERNETLKLLK